MEEVGLDEGFQGGKERCGLGFSFKCFEVFTELDLNEFSLERCGFLQSIRKLV